MLNKIILKGNIGRSPRFEKTQAGKDVGKFFLATTQSWKDEGGEWQKHTDWHRITVLKTSALKWMRDILKRGDQVYVEGKLSYHKWADQYGQERATPHVMVTNREGQIELIRSSGSSGIPEASHIPDEGDQEELPPESPPLSEETSYE
jgi:single-strand DNA-binding protein